MKALKDTSGNIHSIKEIDNGENIVVMQATGDQPHPIYDVFLDDLQQYNYDNDLIIENLDTLDIFEGFIIVEIP